MTTSDKHGVFVAKGKKPKKSLRRQKVLVHQHLHQHQY